VDSKKKGSGGHIERKGYQQDPSGESGSLRVPPTSPGKSKEQYCRSGWEGGQWDGGREAAQHHQSRKKENVSKKKGKNWLKGEMSLLKRAQSCTEKKKGEKITEIKCQQQLHLSTQKKKRGGRKVK